MDLLSGDGEQQLTSWLAAGGVNHGHCQGGGQFHTELVTASWVRVVGQVKQQEQLALLLSLELLDNGFSKTSGAAPVNPAAAIASPPGTDRVIVPIGAACQWSGMVFAGPIGFQQAIPGRCQFANLWADKQFLGL